MNVVIRYIKQNNLSALREQCTNAVIRNEKEMLSARGMGRVRSGGKRTHVVSGFKLKIVEILD